jgi:hypothetical protein
MARAGCSGIARPSSCGDGWTAPDFAICYSIAMIDGEATMKKFAAILLAAGLFSASPALAQSVSPLLGSWAVDTTRLPIPPEARPKSVTFTYGDAGKGKWRTTVDIIGNDGSESHAVSVATLDGAPAPVTGSSEADMIALKVPVSDVLVMALGKGGVPASTRIYTVAPDLKSMVETAVYFGADGKPIMRTNYLTRVR